jgi:hypothetical protein
MHDCPNDDVTARRLTYERLAAERNRMRDARSFFARQLGPLPAFAGISVALVGAFSEDIGCEAWLWVALAIFALMIVVSILYSGMPPYRELRANRVDGGTEGVGTQNPADWYDAEIALEKAIYASESARPWFWQLPLRRPQGDLQEQLDKERVGYFLAQVLFLLVIASLLLAVFASTCTTAGLVAFIAAALAITVVSLKLAS